MSVPPWRIVFFGTPSFALPTLRGLLDGPDEMVGVVTQPDREKGRGRKIVISPVKELALRHGLTPLQPEKVKEEAFQEAVKGLHPDLFVVVAYGQILPKPVLNIPKYGAVNVHASLLPRYRGAAPIAWAILKGEKVTGVTTMVMDEGMDTGDILLQAEVPIGREETCENLHDRLAPLGAQLLSIDYRENEGRRSAGRSAGSFESDLCSSSEKGRRPYPLGEGGRRNRSTGPRFQSMAGGVYEMG